jgi:exodeoxyribonuclease VII large subunit
MSPTYLDVPFKEKDQAKALGARWDVTVKKWYAPEGRDLAPFNAWLPSDLKKNTLNEPVSFERLPLTDSTHEALVLQKNGITLSRLLFGVSQAVAEAFKSGVWTLVEVVEARPRNGHVYLEISERDTDGKVLAKANSTIWASTANKILPDFEKATGASLAPGIKLLVRAKPVYKPQYGFSIEIDAIDPDYTLGNLEARKREIRTRLQQEGVFTANKRLPAPWDYTAVLVIAPPGAAGLGDFQAEAQRLTQFGICQFIYASSRFQGEGAAIEIKETLLAALDQWKVSGTHVPDAVVILRGDGAVNDLAWLNDYALARTLCDLSIPVLTGIGHERDTTILDEVAHTRFDTPSKVVTGIEQVIKKRVQEAKDYFSQLTTFAHRTLSRTRTQLESRQVAVQTHAVRHLTLAQQNTQSLVSDIRLEAVHTLHRATQEIRDLKNNIRHEAHQQLSLAKREVPTLFSEVRHEAHAAVKSARTQVASKMEAVRDRAVLDSRRSHEAMETHRHGIAQGVRRSLTDASAQTTALFREIAGQGPDKTLSRGFALVRNVEHTLITRITQTHPGQSLEIQFRDGLVTSLVTPK